MRSTSSSRRSRSPRRRRRSSSLRPDGRVALPLVAFVALGLPYGMVGPAWPSIRAHFHQPLGALGLLAVLSTAGAAAASLPSGWIRRRIGAAAQLSLGLGIFAASTAAFAVSPWWAGLLVASVTLGAGGAALDAGMNAHVALRHGPRMMNALHAGYGIGATIAPPVVAAAIALGSWRGSFAAVAFAIGAVAAALWVRRAWWPTAAPAREERHVAAPAAHARTLAVSLGLFFVGVGLEVAIGSWAYTLLVDARGADRGVAAAWLSAYWAFFTGGRALLGLGGHRVTPARVVTIGSVLTLAGCALLWADPAGLGVLGLPLAGTGLSGVFPSLVTLTPLRLGVERAPAAIGYQVAAGTAGAAAVTAVAGLVAQSWGLESLGPFLVACAVAMVALDAAARSESKSHARV